MTYNTLRRRTRRRRTGMTSKSYLGSLRKWTRTNPGYYERTVMLKKCGKKCFLGSQKTFPICARGTCKVSRAGVQSAYIRAREMVRRSREKTISKHGKSYYYEVAKKARNLLYNK